MSYRTQYIEAVHRSATYDLIQPSDVLPLLPKPISRKKLMSYLEGSLFFFQEQGITDSSRLMECCASVHAALSEFLTLHKYPCHVTIGEFHWNKQPFFPFYTIEEITAELESPSENEELKAHCWLTLPDGSTLDWTINSDIAKMKDLPYQPLNVQAIHVPFGEHDSDHYYVPLLVGKKGLERLQAINF